MPKIVKMTSGSFRRPDFEGSLAFRGDSPVRAVRPHNDIANEIVITLGTRNDWSIQAVKDLPILQPFLLVCPPKTGPGGMRVSEAPRGQETTREATHG